MSAYEWHRLMLKDQVRNHSYHEAIRRIVRKGAVVCDLGAGTGFLSMLCAKHGASRVYAIEAAEGIIHDSARLIKKNGFAHIIQLIHAPSTEVHLKEKVDVLISETFGSHPFEENAYEFIKDGIKRFLKKDGHVIPCQINTYLAPAENLSAHSQYDLFKEPIEGLDFSLLRPHTLNAMYAECAQAENLLAAGQCIESLTFFQPASSQRKQSSVFTISRDGYLTHLIQWFSLKLCQDIELSTSPHSEKTHWRQIIYNLDQAVSVKAGDILQCELHLDTRLSVGIRVDFHVTLLRQEKPIYAYHGHT